MRREDIEKLNSDSIVEALCWVCKKPFNVNELLVVELFVSNSKYTRMLKGYAFKCKNIIKENIKK